MAATTSVLIIGGGPAGAVAASLIAAAGLDVTVIEQHRFPRDKVCGECLSALGIEVLERIGAAPLVRALDPVVFRRAVLHAPSGASLPLALPRPMWGISRARLDSALLDHARGLGAKLEQPARCEQIEAPDFTRVRIRDLCNNVVRTLRADVILLADGKAALMPRSPAPSSDFGLKAHFRGVQAPMAEPAIELFGVDGHYGGLAPVGDGLVNASFSVPSAHLRAARGDLDTLFARIVPQNRSLMTRVRFAERAGPWIVSPLPRFAVAVEWPARILPIGNAAAALEPIGGEGMGLAMRSAELAVEAVVAAARAGRSLSAGDAERVRCAYRGLWQARSCVCRLAAWALARPWLANAIVPLLDGGNPMVRLVLNRVGKGA